MIERLDDYIDIPAIERQTNLAIENIERLVAAFEKLQKKSADASKKIRPPETHTNTKSNLPAAVKGANESTEGIAEEIALQKELEASQKRINALKAKAAQLATEQAAEEAKLREQNKQAKREIELSVKADLVKVGSLDAMKVALAQLTGEYNSLEKAEREAESGKELQAKIADLAKEIKEAEFALGNFRSNVGNYPDTSREMNALISQMEDLKNAGRAGSEEFMQMSTKLDELLLSTQGLATGEKSLKLELRENIALLARMKRAGLDNTEAYQNLVKETGELEDAIADTREEVKRYASDTQTLDQAIGVFKGIGAAAQVAEGASALLGDENEDLTKSIQKMVAIQTVLSGAQEIGNALQKESTFMMGLASVKTNVLSVSQRIYTMVVGTSTGALKAFKLALAGTGIGLIIIALGYLISHWQDVTEAISGYTKQQRLLNEIEKSAIENTSAEIAKLEILRKHLINAKIGTEERSKALKDWNVLADVGNQLSEETSKSTEKVNAAIDRQRSLILQRARAKAIEEKLSEKIKERMELELELAHNVEQRGKIEEDMRRKGQKGMMQIFDKFNIDKVKNKIAEIDKDMSVFTDKERIIEIDISVRESIKKHFDQIKEVEKAATENIENSREKALKLRQIQYYEEIKDAEGNADLKTQIAIKYNRDISDISREYSQKTASAERETAQSLTEVRMSLLREGFQKEQTLLISESTQKKTALEERLKYEKELSSSTRQNINNTILAIDQKLKKDQEELQLKYYQESARIENDLLSIRSETMRVVAENDKLSLEERIIAYANYQQMREVQIENAAALDIEAAGDNADKIKLIEEQKNSELISLRQSVFKSVEDLTREQYSKTEKAALDHVSTLVNSEYIALNDQYTKGLISKEEYEKRKLEISNRYAKKEIEIQLKSLAMQLMANRNNEKEREEIQKRISELHKQKSDMYLTDFENEEERLKAIKQMSIELTKTTVNSAFEIYNESQNKRLTQIEEQKTANQQAMEKELEQAGSNEDLKSQIKEKYAVRDRKLDKERRKIEHDKAVAAKITALFEIAINTAVAASSQLANPLMLAFVLAMGAAQAAAVASREVPKYAKGREDGPAEIAWVGEKGTEIIEEPSGKSYWTPGKPTLTYLPAHAKVIPHDEVERRILIQEAFEGRPLTVNERMTLAKMEGGDITRILAEAQMDPEGVNIDKMFSSREDRSVAHHAISKLISQVNMSKLSLPSIKLQMPHIHPQISVPKSNSASVSRQYDFRRLEQKIENLSEVVRNKKELHLNITKSGMQAMSKSGSSWTEYIDDQLKS